MGRLWLMFATLVFSILFLIKRPTGEIGFPYSKEVLKADTYGYYTYEQATTLIFAILIMGNPNPRYKSMYVLFIVIQLIDWIDFHLFFRDDWFKNCPPWNAMKCVLFGVPLLFESWKKLQQALAK